jgi:uncharacterized damage-inducible protein DinB
MSITKDRPVTAPSLQRLALGDLEQELATTRRVLERVPEDRLDWQPHAKSMSLGKLAMHVATIPFYGERICRSDEFDLASAPQPNIEGVKSRTEVLEAFETRAAALQEALATTDEAALGEPWSLRVGDRVISTLPRVAAMRAIVISHMVHHRAQLSVYLRLLDVPVPSIYGPSADEPNF